MTSSDVGKHSPHDSPRGLRLMAPRPPADAVVALRSLPRLYRGLFAGLGDDESPDDLAHRVGAGGRSAFDHVAAASRSLTTQDRALEQVLAEDSPTPDRSEEHTSEPHQQLRTS